MSVSLLAQIRGDRGAQGLLHETVGLEHAMSGLLVGAGLDGLRDERHPRVEDAVFETSKGVAKGHVADDVEGGRGRGVGGSG